MLISKKHLEKFDSPDTLVILSSFPKKGGEVAVENALARYTRLLVKNFPKNQKIVIVSEKRAKGDKDYLVRKNILVVPTLKKNSLFFAFDVERVLAQFSLSRNLLVQFEFSVFGGKRVIPGVSLVLAIEKLRGRYITTMLHQVVRDLSPLSGHLGLNKNGIKSRILSGLLSLFYKSTAGLSDKIIVHDAHLKSRLATFVESQKIQVVPHGIDPPRRFTAGFVKKSREAFGFTKSEKIVTLFGSRSWYKGTVRAVSVFGEIARRYPKRKIRLFLVTIISPPASLTLFLSWAIWLTVKPR